MSQDIITPGVVSSIVDPEPHSPPAGDWHDDDGQALDAYFQSAQLGPQILAALRDMTKSLANKPSTDGPEAGSRILRTRLYLGGAAVNQPAVKAFPADAQRVKMVIIDINNNGFYFHSESFTCVDTPTLTIAQTAAFFTPAVAGATAPQTACRLELDNYTGPIWVTSRFENAAALEILTITS